MELKFTKDLVPGRVANNSLYNLKKRRDFYLAFFCVFFIIETMNQTASGPILTTDGIPLKVSLLTSERLYKIRAFLLVAPLLVFILVTFLIPIADMLVRSIDDRHINTVFPKTFEVYKKWDQQGLPSEELYETMFFEVKDSVGFHIGKASTRMNYSKSGWKSLLKKL